MGLDRRLIVPTLAILVVQIILAGVIPVINDSVHSQEFAAGTVLALRGGVEFTPAPHWYADSVPHPSTPQVTIFHDGVRMTVATGNWKGTPQQLLDQVVSDYSGDFKVKGDPETFDLAQGFPGAGTNITTVNHTGVLFAFVTDKAAEEPGAGGRKVAVTVRVQAPVDTVQSNYTQDIADMIASIHVNEGKA
jgi:hypothetical protein